MRFLHPSIAWWFLAMAVGVVAVRLLRRRRPRGLATSSRRLLDPAYRASMLRHVPSAVFAIALMLLACALMEPVLPFAQTQVRSHGLDIVIALDLSSSMEEGMGSSALSDASARRGPFKTRLDATKEAIREFVSLRIDDRIGMVVFSDNAYVVSPLTFDHAYLLRYIDMVDDQILRGEGMTAIGDGLAVANRLLARQASVPGAHNKVVVIFTDGENNMGREPLEVLGESDSQGVRVHLVGVDLEAEVKRKPPVQALVRAVTRYGGRYFDAGTERQLHAASRAIDGIEKGVLVSQTYEHDAPVFDWFAVPSLIAFAIGFCLRALPPFIDQT